MGAEVRLITPKYAQELIDSMANRPNYRPVTPSKVFNYAKDIEGGNWHLNGETIKLRPDGSLFDGQHRCLAVVRANKPIRSWVIWADDEMGVDRGQPRKFSHLLAHRGVINAKSIQAMTNVLYSMHLFNELRDGMPARTDDELWAFYSESLDANLMQECASAGKAINKMKLASPAQWGSFLYLIADKNREIAFTFHERVLDGASLAPTSPILLLRNRLISMHMQRGLHRPRMVLALAIKAWNAHVQGRTLGTLKFLESEVFPSVVDTETGL